MNQFLQSRTVRSREYRWDHNNDKIVHISEDPSDIMSETKNLIKNYGMVSTEKFMAFEALYIDGKVQSAQDIYMLLKCLMN